MILMILLLAVFGCIDPYNPPEIAAEQEYLVIDGSFHPNEISEVYLSYTQNLTDEEVPATISNAQVVLEVKGDQSYEFSSRGNGSYQLMPLDLPLNSEVRLQVNTQGKSYVSGYVPVLPTPEIDSISFEAQNDGMQFFVNTRDPQNNTWYYRWEFTDTWQISSVYDSRFEFVNNSVIPRQIGIYYCWKSNDSKDIYATTSSNLSQDVISMFPLHKVGSNSEKLRIKYSVLVKQYALTREAYEYYRELKSNTESLGTLFDPLPFQLNGNFSNINDPDEPVIGFFYAAETTDKRIFVDTGDHNYFIRNGLASMCEMDTVLNADFAEVADRLLIVDEYYGEFSPVPIGYLMSSSFCTDCRLYGTNVRPEFWQ